MKPLINTDRPSRKPRTRKDMIEYLNGHFRYDTMSSWNRSTSYAVNVKLHKITFPDKDTEDAAYMWIWRDGDFNEPIEAARRVFDEFAERHGWGWQIGFNGRSSGYLVLYDGGRKQLDHKSRCSKCWQLNFKLVPPEPLRFPDGTSEARLHAAYNKQRGTSVELLKQLPEVKSLGFFPGEIEQRIAAIKSREVDPSKYTPDNKCGRCGAMARVNLSEPLYETFTTGKGTDEERDFENWETDNLKYRVELIWDFDKTVEAAVAAFVEEVRFLGAPMSDEEEEDQEDEEPDGEDDEDNWGEVANG